MSDELVALVYRAGCVACGRSCCPHAKGRGRQYAFATVAELGAWASRKPYRNEVLKVIVIGADRREVKRDTIPAGEAAQYVFTALTTPH